MTDSDESKGDDSATIDYSDFLKTTVQETKAFDIETHSRNLDEDYLLSLEALSNAASPAPWYPRYGDDNYCMNARWISTEQSDKFGFLYNEPSTSVIAITLLQSPRLADAPDFYDNNMMLICEYRKAVPLLINEIRKLRKELADGR